MTTDRLLHHVRIVLERQGLFQDDTTLVVAVSGGPDSLCLLHLLWRLKAEGGPNLHVAHLDHGFRGEQSAAEAHFVTQTAQTLQLPVTVEHHDIPAIAQEMRQNAQATARAYRYAFLARVAHAIQAQAVAVAHQADDQAETVLLHLLRGAGPTGLRGMQVVVPWPAWQPQAEQVNGQARRQPALPSHRHLIEISCPLLIRPLLQIPRSDIEDYCTAQQLTPQHDPSNTAPYYTRSRIRIDLLPQLAAYNQQIIAALGRTAQICADDHAYIQSQLDRIWPELAQEHTGVVRLDREQWQQLPPALQRYALRRVAWYLLGYDELSYDHIEAGRAAATERVGYQQTLEQGLLLRVEHTSLWIINSTIHRSSDVDIADLAIDIPQLAVAEIDLVVPGITIISPLWQAETSFVSWPAPPTGDRWRWWVTLDHTTLDAPLRLRRRRSGDRFQPSGGAGTRRLQDFFVDQKVPRMYRSSWPILATVSNIVWVAGLRADRRFQATTDTIQPLWVKLVHRPHLVRSQIQQTSDTQGVPHARRH